MESHVRVLGVLRIVYGAIGVLIGVAGLLLLGGIGAIVGIAASEPDAMVAAPVLSFIGIAVFLFFSVLSVPSMIAGWGLLRYAPWARLLTIALSCLDLLNFPFGTALGVYGLWVLFARETTVRFEGRPVPHV
jgi:hypothetical protein